MGNLFQITLYILISSKCIEVFSGNLIRFDTGYKLQLSYSLNDVYLFDKENLIGRKQLGRENGELKCGLYYQSGSLMSRLAFEGNQIHVMNAPSNGETFSLKIASYNLYTCLTDLN